MASKFFSFVHSKKEKSLAPVCRAVPYMSKEALLADKDESELMLVDYKRADRIQSARQLWLNWLCTLCLLLLALQAAASVAVVSMWTRNVCNEQKCAKVTSAWSPALEAVQYQERYFDGTKNASAIYGGRPTAEMDLAWDELTQQPAVAISRDELVNHLGKDAIYSVHDEEHPATYFGFLEVFHLLHCVDILRRYTYREHYEQYFTMLGDALRGHLDHCIDALRINLMCAGNVDILTFKWAEGNSYPHPDFWQLHKCRDLDKVVNWLNKSPRVRHDLVWKPDDVTVEGHAHHLG